MVVVDTCAFIPLLRGEASPELQTLIVAGLVRMSSTVFLELIQGVRKRELKPLMRFLTSLGEPLAWPALPYCLKALRGSYGSGLRVGIPDLMVLGDCLTNNAKLMTLDRNLKELAARVGVKTI